LFKKLIKNFFLYNCGLTLNEVKTLITLLTKEFTFLGANIRKLRLIFLLPRTKTSKLTNNYIMVIAPIPKVLDYLK